MSPPQLLAGLSDVASDYDAVLCDVWGVIHNGRRAFQPACEALVRFRQAGGRVALITNAPVPKAQVLRYFKPLGVPDAAFDDCVSSGDTAREALAAWGDKRVWVIGADEGFEHDRFLYRGLDARLQSREPGAEGVLCIGLRDGLNDDPEAYRDDLRPAAERGLEMICANPDIKVRVGDALHWCAGALARIYEDLGGPVIYPGKPHPPIYDAALDRLGEKIDRSRVLAIGDGPATDLKGANAQGIDALYVGTGLAAHDGGDFVAETEALMREASVRARYAMPELAW